MVGMHSYHSYLSWHILYKCCWNIRKRSLMKRRQHKWSVSILVESLLMSDYDTLHLNTQFCPSPPRWVNQPCRWWTWRNWSRSGTDSFKHTEPGKAGAAKLPSKFKCSNVEILSCTSATLVKTVYWKLLGDFGNESPGVKNAACDCSCDVFVCWGRTELLP